MTINYTTLLGLALPVTGTESGTWGDDVSLGITQYLDTVIAGTNNITNDSDITLTITNGSSSGSNIVASPNSTTAQYMQLLCTGARTANRNINAPNSSKMYIVNNATTGGYSITLRGTTGPTTGVTVINGEKCVVYWSTVANDFIKITSSVVSNLTGILPLPNGGTNANLTASNGGIVYSNASQMQILSGTATANQIILSGSSTTPSWSTATYPATTTINQLLYSSASNTITGLATVAAAVLTTVSSVPTWANQLSLALGGTNANLTASAGAIAYSGASALALNTAGTSGQALLSGGTGAPTFGTLGLTYGGTNATLTASNGGIVYSTASALGILSGTATAGQLLASGSSTTPAWTTSTFPTSTVAINSLLYASSANTWAALATANSSVLTTNSSGVPSWAALSTIGVTSFSAGTTGFTPSSGTTGAITLAGTLSAANGGTGVANNAASTLTITGNFGTTLTVSGTTSLTLPTSGTVTALGNTTTGSGTTLVLSTAPTFTTSITTPLVYGGTTASSSLTFQSTSGVGTSDSILFKVGNAGATTAISIATTGIVSLPTTGALLLPKGTTAQEPTGVAGYLRFNTDTTQFEGYNGSAWASVGGAALSNDTTSTTAYYPLFAHATSGTALTIYTSNTQYTFKPSTGELTAPEVISSNGFMINGTTVSTSYTIASGNNAFSVGPVTVNTGVSVTVSSGQRWVVI